MNPNELAACMRKLAVWRCAAATRTQQAAGQADTDVTSSYKCAAVGCRLTDCRSAGVCRQRVLLLFLRIALQMCSCQMLLSVGGVSLQVFCRTCPAALSALQMQRS